MEEGSKNQEIPEGWGVIINPLERKFRGGGGLK